MKRLILIWSMYVLSCISASGQPKPASTAALAQMIDQQYSDSMRKIQTAYSWVTANIRYDTRQAFAINNSNDPRSVIDVAFERRAGVCENFAAIFSDICQKMGFQALVIEGYGIRNNIADRVAHSWAAVYLDKDWYLFDPTWDAGRTGDFLYFKNTGEAFLNTHQPFDPIWQMTNYPRLENNMRSRAFFNYKDSIEAHLSLDSLKRYEAINKRIDHSGKTNELTSTHQKVINNNLEIKRQEQQMEWYDTAVGLLNDVSNALNDFIDLRNAQFSSVKEEGKLSFLLAGLESILDSAGHYLSLVDQSEASLVYGTGPAREQMQRLEKKLADQKLFLQKYLVADLQQRRKMF